MSLSLRPEQRPEMRMHTVSIEEILKLAENYSEGHPPLENYFSPTRKEVFEKDYTHYINTLLLEVKHRNLDLELFLVFVLSFQFIAPLLGIPLQNELRLFYQALEQRYDMDEIDLNLHFTRDDFEETTERIEYNPEEKEKVETIKILKEEEVIDVFTQELDETYNGRREVKERVQKRLKADGIQSIMKWQQKKADPELAEAFGRAIVIPAFFSFKDKKLTDFYKRTTSGIKYELAVPDFET